MHVALHRPIAAGRVGIEPTACLDRHVHGFLHRLDSEILDGMDHNSTLPTHPRNNRGPVFVIMAPTRLAFLAATTRSATQRFLPALFCLPLLTRSVIEVIRFDSALQLAIYLIA